MSTQSDSWSTQQLAEFVAAVASVADGEDAIRSGVERVAEALDADAVALISDERVASSVGWPTGAAPVDLIRGAVASAPGALVAVPVPGFGELPVVAVEVGESGDAMLLVARDGDPLDAEEKGLLRAMARALGLAVHNHEVMRALRERQRLLEGLSGIQRAIARRAPLQEVLNSIVLLGQELVGDDQTALMLRVPGDADGLRVVASVGVPAEILNELDQLQVGAGTGGAAVAEDRMIITENYLEFNGALPALTGVGLMAAMSAPVHEDGHAVGSLTVSSYSRGRTYSQAEREMLASLAEHATLALADARTVSDMVYQALHDPLTGMPNRNLFNDRLTHALQRADRVGADVGILYIDLDRFKPVNDRLGHDAGDELLRIVAGRIDECVRGSDTAARLGGDEFAVLIEDLESAEQATDLAQRIIDVLRTPLVLRGRDLTVGASVGITIGHQRDADALLRQADMAMYRAKSDGKGRFVLYQHHMQTEALERLELEDDLRYGALDRRQLELFYQPIVELDSAGLYGIEALLRWRHPDRGLVSPATFIPLAEEPA